jgi:hypothetical protein
LADKGTTYMNHDVRPSTRRPFGVKALTNGASNPPDNAVLRVGTIVAIRPASTRTTTLGRTDA